MHTPYDYCPKCKGKRRVNRYLGLQTIISPQGKVDTLLYCYYCESCNTFIRNAPVLLNESTRSDVQAEIHY
jgi:uncharacterized protein YbaR (Trm112 family)